MPSRYQDENTQAFVMVVSCNRWLGIRLDLLSSVFAMTVAVAAILISENPGECVKTFVIVVSGTSSILLEILLTPFRSFMAGRVQFVFLFKRKLPCLQL